MSSISPATVFDLNARVQLVLDHTTTTLNLAERGAKYAPSTRLAALKGLVNAYKS